MSKHDSSPRPASQSLLTIQISKPLGLMILTALAVIAVLVGFDLRSRGHAQAAPKPADSSLEIADSAPDAAPIAAEPSPGAAPATDASTGQRPPVHVMRSAQEYSMETAASIEPEHGRSPSLPPIAADASGNDSNNSPDTSQPASPDTPDTSSQKNKTPPTKSPDDSAKDKDKGPLSLAGAGAQFPYPIYVKWFAKFREDLNKKNSDIRVSYSEAGSGAAIAQLLKGKIDFGATDVPMSDEQMTQTHGSILHVPTVLRAVVPIYNIPGVTGEVRFTPEVLADIYLGNITSWNDEAIVKENQGKSFPNQQIVVIHRSDGNSTSYLFTDFLSKVDQQWQGSVGVGTSVQWPVGMGVKEDEGVTQAVRQFDGAIGYVDMRFAKENRLTFGSVRNPAGNFLSASLETMTDAAASIRDMPPDFRVSFTNARGAKAYPITGFTWLLVPMDEELDQNMHLKRAPQREALMAFLGWMLDNGETMTAGLDYAPLPKNVTTEVRRRIGVMQ